MKTYRRQPRENLIDATLMEDLAMTAGRSAEALFGYFTRLDYLRDADLAPCALADRAAQAELHARVVLSAGMDALNELNDLGLLSNVPTEQELEEFNQMQLQDALGLVAETFRERIPTQRWDWLNDAGRLLEGVKVCLERDEKGMRGSITHSGQTTVFFFDPAARPTRVSTDAFFSDGPERVYVPASAVFAPGDQARTSRAPYDINVQAMAFAREWVYRHARNAAEIGPPGRTGGGPVIPVIIIILVIAAAVASVAVAILAIVCSAGSDKACRLAAYLGLASTVMTGSAEYMDTHSGQPRVLTYGTNIR